MRRLSEDQMAAFYGKPLASDGWITDQQLAAWIEALPEPSLPPGFTGRATHRLQYVHRCRTGRQRLVRSLVVLVLLAAVGSLLVLMAGALPRPVHDLARVFERYWGVCLFAGASLGLIQYADGRLMHRQLQKIMEQNIG